MKVNQIIKTFISICALVAFILQIRLSYEVTRIEELIEKNALERATLEDGVEHESILTGVEFTKEFQKKSAFFQNFVLESADGNGIIDKVIISKEGEPKKKSKQKLILHVGPPKTGTTSLQHGLFEARDTLIEQDNYIYLSREDDLSIQRKEQQALHAENRNMTHVKPRRLKHPHFVWSVNPIMQEFRTVMKEAYENDNLNWVENQGIDYERGWEDNNFPTPPPREKKYDRRDKYRERKKRRDKIHRKDTDDDDDIDDAKQKKQKKKLRSFNRLLYKLDKCYGHGASVIISAEQFCFDDKLLPNDPIVWDIFLPPLERWDIHVVITYRRYYEWITSYYFQLNVMRMFPKRKQTFAEFAQNVLEQSHDLELEGRSIETHPTYHVYAKFIQQFEKVHVMNLHEDTGEDVVTKFICDAIPDAVHTCSMLASSKQVTHELRKSREMDFDLLIQGAIDKKFLRNVSSNIDFKIASNDASEFYRNNFPKPVPYVCLDKETTELIFDMSESFEKQLIPHFYEKLENQKSHREGFLKAIANNKFCDLDVENILKDVKWKRYFREYDAKLLGYDRWYDLEEEVQALHGATGKDRKEIYENIIKKIFWVLSALNSSTKQSRASIK